jgi:asparagine synthase (glutamine-hydrolysing)
MNQVWIGSFNHESQARLLNKDLGLLFTVEKIYEDILNHVAEAKGDAEGFGSTNNEEAVFNGLLSYYFNFYLQNDILTKVDRAGMANSLEVRAPFLDREFIEYVSRIGYSVKLKGWTSKYILKMAMRGKLPKNIIGRIKRGFSTPIAKWLKNELRGVLTDVLSPGYLKSQGLFNPLFVESLVKEHLCGKRDNCKQLWTLFMFEMWYKEYFN